MCYEQHDSVSAFSFGLAIMLKALLRTDTDNSALLNTTNMIKSFCP